MEDSKLSKHEINEIVMVGGSSCIHKVQELLSQFFEGKELCKSIHQDEAIAYGAAMQEASLNKENINLVLVEMTPLSLGIKIENGVMKVIVPCNTPIPTMKEAFIPTKFDNQTNVRFSIYEGERPLVAHNNFLGKFVLDRIIPEQCRKPTIRVNFEVDVEGIVTSSATELGTRLRNQITITNERERLIKEDIDRMVANADIFQKEDEEMTKKHIVKNNLECYVCNMKSRMTKARQKGTMQKSLTKGIMQDLNNAEEWLDCNDFVETYELQANLDELTLKCKPLI